MILRELGRSKSIQGIGGLTLLAGAVFLPVLLEPVELGLLAPVGSLALAYGGTALLGHVPEARKLIPPILLKALPGLNVLRRREAEISERRRVAADMKAALGFHAVAGLDEVSWEVVERELVTDPALAGRDGGVIVAACARHLATILSLPTGVLELLHHERNATVPAWMWPPRMEVRGSVIPALARVLAGSRVVRRHLGPELDLDGPELEAVLEGLPSFELESFLTELRVDRDRWRTGHAFWAFLSGNFAGLGAPPTIRQMLRGARGAGGRSSGRADVPVLNGLGWRAVREWQEARGGTPALTETECEAVTVLAEILFFIRSGLPPLRGTLAPLCERLATLQDGVALAWVYLVAKKEFRDELWGERERYLRLDLFLERRPEILERRPAKPDELAVLEDVLRAGTWLISRQELLGRFAAAETASAKSEAEAPDGMTVGMKVGMTGRAGPGEARRIAPPAPASAIRSPQPSEADRVERLTEAQGVRPYMITLGRSAGPVPKILDELARSETDRYDFEQYTPFSRIGVVPQGVAFIDFCKTLRADLESRLPPDNGDPSSYEVLVHAFRPAESNPFVIGQGERPALRTMREMLASRRLAGSGGRA